MMTTIQLSGTRTRPTTPNARPRPVTIAMIAMTVPIRPTITLPTPGPRYSAVTSDRPNTGLPVAMAAIPKPTTAARSSATARMIRLSTPSSGAGRGRVPGLTEGVFTCLSPTDPAPFVQFRRPASPVLAPDRPIDFYAVAMATPATELTIGERTVRVSNPDKIYFPEVGLTKIDIVNYVVAVGDGFLPALLDRPVTMERWPGGYSPDAKLSTRESRFGEAFYQKRAPAKGMPDWVETTTITFPSGRTATQVCVTELATIGWMAQLGTLR